jgi:hypothetical protein
VRVVAVQRVAEQPGGVPQLRPAGVEVDVGAPAEAGQQRRVGEAAGQVQQGGPVVGDRGEVGSAQAPAAGVEQRGPSGQPVLRGHRVEPRGLGPVGGDVRRLDQVHVDPEVGQAAHPRQPHPRLPAVAGLVRQGAGDDDRAHAALMPCSWQPGRSR